MLIPRTLLLAFGLALALGASLSANAASKAQSGRYYDDAARGWVWYEDPRPEPPPPPKEPPVVTAQPAASSAQPAPFSAAWLRVNLDKYRDAAIDSPTEENVATYFYLQRVVMDKSERFADMGQRVVLNNPALDENQRSPQTTIAKITARRIGKETSDSILKRVAGHAGLWYFFRSDCPYCHAESPVLELLQREYGFTVLPISLDAKPLRDGHYPAFRPDQGQGARLGVRVTPTLFLVTTKGEVVQLAEGLQTADEIERRVFEKGHDMGLVSDAEHDSATKEMGGSTNMMDALPTDLPADIANDPRRMAELLRAAALQGGATAIAASTPASPQTKEATR